MIGNQDDVDNSNLVISFGRKEKRKSVRRCSRVQESVKHLLITCGGYRGEWNRDKLLEEAGRWLKNEDFRKEGNENR